MNELYVYLAVLIGTFVEGEAVLLTAAFASHGDNSSIYVILIAAFVGVQATDWLYFLLARFKAKSFLENRPKFQKRVQKFTTILDKRPLLFLLTYRFIYGARTIIPFSIGMSNISIRKFGFFCAIDGLVWAIVYTSIGYFGSKAIYKHLDYLEPYIFPIVIVVILFASSTFLTIWWIRKRKKQMRQ